MARIDKVISWENRGKYALVKVLVNQVECTVIIGGEVETWHSDKYDRSIAWVKKQKPVHKPIVIT